MPRKKKDADSKSTKSGGKKPEPPKPEENVPVEPVAPEPTPEPPAAPEPAPEPDPPANAPTVEKNKPSPPKTRKDLEAKLAKERAEAGITTSTDGRRARPPMKDGKVDIEQAETWTKDPKTGLLTYFFSNGAQVREDEL